MGHEGLGQSNKRNETVLYDLSHKLLQACFPQVEQAKELLQAFRCVISPANASMVLREKRQISVCIARKWVSDEILLTSFY